jgi:hypothetical protein
MGGRSGRKVGKSPETSTFSPYGTELAHPFDVT